MEAASLGRSSPVTPRVWTRGVRTSPLVPLVSSQRVLQVATTPPVTWTAPFPLWFALSRAHRLLRVAAAASASSRARVSVPPAERLHPALRQLPRFTVVMLAAAAEPWLASIVLSVASLPHRSSAVVTGVVARAL